MQWGLSCELPCGFLSVAVEQVVQAYMLHIQANAEQAVRAMLTTFSHRQQLPEVTGPSCLIHNLNDITDRRERESGS
jgi:hypothetical protein